MSKKISQNCLDLVKEFEGCQLKAYRDEVGVWTIGYGITNSDKSITGVTIRSGLTISKATAEKWLEESLNKKYLPLVLKYDTKYDWNQNQLDALVSFAYNIGSIKQLTADGTRSIKTIASKMLEYNKAGGKVYRGLTRRRQAEQKLFLTSVKTEEKAEERLTEDELRKKPVEYMQKYIGIKEGGKEHKAILKTFNSSGLCTRYTMTVKDKWCATAVSAAFISSGLTSGTMNIFPCVECSCKEMISKAKKAGIWKESDSYVPKMGDVMMYDWDDDGKGDDTGDPEHTGVVVSVTNSKIKIIEGNKNDTVAYRTVAVDARYTRGYITPDYASIAAGGGKTEEVEADTDKTEKTAGGGKYMFEVGTVKKGSSGNDVKLLQRLLKSSGCNNADGSVLSIDGIAGSNTVAAVKSYQKKKSLTVDGIAGPKTWKKILLR